MKKELLILMVGMFLGLGACGTDEPEGKPVGGACTVDADCQDGRHCGAGNECTQVCDPSDANTSCPDGQSCSNRGRCVSNGECTVDADCDSPPEELTCDGDVLVGFSETGQCTQEESTTFCDYAETRNACENGCSNGRCNADPCDSVACTTPPAATCDGDTRVSYASDGTCVGDGMCDYTETREECAAGCTSGVCNDAACDAVTCDNPPGDRCDGETAVTYVQTGTCDDSSGTAICDYAPTFNTCTYTGATCDQAACVNPIQQVGGVVIVEYMADPVGSFVDANEWFEITNVSGAEIDLTDWVIRSSGNQSDEVFTIVDNPETTVPAFPAGGTLLLSREATAAGAATVDYVYDDISLANSGDWLQLENAAGEVVDYVYYEPGTLLDGRSRKFNPALAATVDSNDDFGNWCPTLDDNDAYTTNPTNYGTPGEDNTQCAVDPCADWTCEKPEDFCLGLDSALQYGADMAMCEATRLSNPRCDFMATEVMCQGTQLCSSGVCEDIPANLPQDGDVIFTEFMADPDAVSDTNGEWFELYNTTGSELALFSLIVTDNDNDEFLILDASATIPANGYVVFARNDNSQLNGGVTGAIDYPGNLSFLTNSPDPANYQLNLTLQDGTSIAAPYFGPVGGATSMPKGASIQLDPGSLTAAGSQDVANWCAATSSYGSGDLGTPGAANDTCN